MMNVKNTKKSLFLFFLAFTFFISLGAGFGIINIITAVKAFIAISWTLFRFLLSEIINVQEILAIKCLTAE